MRAGPGSAGGWSLVSFDPSLGCSMIGTGTFLVCFHSFQAGGRDTPCSDTQSDVSNPFWGFPTIKYCFGVQPHAGTCSMEPPWGCLGVSQQPGPSSRGRRAALGRAGQEQPLPCHLSIPCPGAPKPKGFAGKDRNIFQLTGIPSSPWLLGRDAQTPQILNQGGRK